MPIKRVDVLLRAFAAARDAGAVHLRLAIVGDGDLRADLEELARSLGCASDVYFLGYRRDLTDLVAAAGLAVLSSDNEGTPVSLIEAGAGGRPAIATDVGGVSAVVAPESGRIVPPGDADALGHEIAALASDVPKRRRMGVAARSHVLSKFSIERLLSDIASIYEEITPPGRANER